MLTLSPRDLARVKQAERRWQEDHGAALQEAAYRRKGTQVVLYAQYARIAEALSLGPRSRVLDLGCGAGHLLGWLTQRASAEFHGLDLSFNSLLHARRRGTGRLVVWDAEALPYADARFDCVICNGSAHHFLDERAVFREIHRILALGGRLVLYEPLATPFTSALRTLFLSKNKDLYESPADLAHKEEFTPHRARALLVDAGFREVSISLHDSLAYPLSGNYVHLPMSKSARLMKCLLRWEHFVTQYSALRRISDLLAWRLLVVAQKSSAP